MDDYKERKERAVKAANSKGVNNSGFRWLLLLASLPLIVVALIIILIPGVADWMDGWSPLTVTVCVMIILLIFYFYIRHKTK